MKELACWKLEVWNVKKMQGEEGASYERSVQTCLKTANIIFSEMSEKLL
jgi:hypothetical protein